MRARAQGLLLFCTLHAAREAACELFNLDDRVPQLTSNGNAVRWSGGWDALTAADSCCMRVNARGIYAKPSHWTPREDLRQAGWASAPCMADGRGGLCTAEFGVLFPSLDVPRYNASAPWGGAGCSRASDGRSLDPGYGYDVSACDVLDGGGDAVVCGRTAYFRRTAVPVGVYWTLCVLAVFVVRALGYLVVHRVKGKGAPAAFSEHWDNLLTVVACTLVLPLTLASDGVAGFVTVEEQFFFVTVCCYAGAYVGHFANYTWNADGESARDPPIYNMIAATLQIIASRLYLSAETPYNPVIIWAVMTRALLKLRTKGGLASSLTTFADSLILSLMCVIGFGYNPLYLVALFTLSMATSDAID